MTKSPPTRGRSLLFLHFLPALLLACFVTVVFWWNPFGPQPEHGYFEVMLRPSVSGETQLVADIDGSALRKEYTMSQPIKAGEINHVRFTLRAGKLKAVIFTPSTADGDIDLLRCWMATERGEVVAIIPPSSLAGARPDVIPLPNGGVRLPGHVGAATTGLTFTADSPIDLAMTPPPPPWQIAAVFLCTLLAALLLSRNAAKVPWRRATAAIWKQARLHPRKAILVAAIVAVTVSCFPVIFWGKSFLSPDNGVQLLYENFPTVPGAKGGRVENPTGGDMGATFFWHLPASIVQHRAVFEDGEFPLWDRYNWCGVALWSQCMSMFGDPLHWPTVVAGGSAWSWDFKYLAAKLLFALGVGLLVRVSSRSLPAALLITLSAPFIGFFTYRACHPGFFSLCYAPWILLPWLEAAKASTLKRVAGWAALLLFANWWQLNSGTAKEAMAFLLCLNAVGALAIVVADLPAGERARRLGVFVWANVLFVLLSAPLWLVFIDALGKAWTAYDEPRVAQIQPSIILGLFDDIFYRQLTTMEFMSFPSANFFVLLGTAWSLVRVRSLVADRIFLATLIGTAGVAAITFGVISPLVLAEVPLIRNIFHFDDTFSGVLFILLFVLAGYGIRECRNRMRLPEWRGDWVAVLCLVGVLLAAFFGFTHAGHRVGRTLVAVGQTIPCSDFFWEYGTALVLALAGWSLAWRMVRLRRPAATTWFLIACAAWATMHFRHGMQLVTAFDFYTLNPKQRLDLREVASPAVRQIQKTMKEPARVSGIDWVMSGINVEPRFEGIDGADALQNPATRDLIAAFGLKAIWGWRILVLRQDFAKVHRGLDMLGVRYFLDKRGKGSELPGLHLLGTSDLDVLESNTAWPRAFFTDTVIAYREVSEMARLVQGGDGRPFAAMLSADRTALPLPAGDLAARQIVPAHDYRLKQNSTRFEIDAPVPGVAVLEEAWISGDIHALVDGQPAKTLRVNHAFRGVLIEKPGHHTIEFYYWPMALTKALWLAAAGLLGLLATIGLFLRRAPRVKPAGEHAHSAATSIAQD